MTMTRIQIEAWLDAERIIGQGRGNVDSVAIDSRRVQPGSLFVPLSGERTDGHLFIEKALADGAAVIPVSSAWAAENSKILEKWSDKALFPVVDDTLRALQNLAKGYRSSFGNLTVVGVTGSNGKTTTKEIIFSILSSSGQAVCNEGNLNSDSGLPLSVFRITGKHRHAVLEMGMNRVGEMAELARVARPDLALVTNVGTAHIGMVGSKDGIAEEKKAVFSQFTGKETAFLNNDDPYTELLARGVKGRIVKYGPGVTEGYEFVREEGIYGQVFRLSGRDVRFPLPGHFNVINALGAVAVARELGFSEEDIVAGLENVGGVFGRGEVVQGKSVTLLRDCYNANGESMVSSLDMFDRAHKDRRHIAVLADMGELGEASRNVHAAVLAKALSCDFHEIYLLGEEFAAALRAAEKDSGAGGLDKCRSFVEYGELEPALVGSVNGGDLILLKGSRVMALERLSEPLLAL